jgi:hypothetical protein
LDGDFVLSQGSLWSTLTNAKSSWTWLSNFSDTEQYRWKLFRSFWD